jgi:hypothetical protein
MFRVQSLGYIDEKWEDSTYQLKFAQAGFQKQLNHQIQWFSVSSLSTGNEF